MKKLTCIVFSFAILASAAFAGQYGILKGKVTSKSDGKPLVGASVLVLETKTGAKTKEGGNYTINNIRAGTYTLKVSFVGYETATIQNIEISSDQTSVQNVKLSDKTSTSKEVVVTADRIMVSKTDVGSKTTVKVTTNTVVENVAGVALQTAGVLASGTGVSIRGSRATETVYKQDGLDIGDGFVGGLGSGGRAYAPSTSNFALDEVQVIKGGLDASQVAMGGVLNTVSKVGSASSYEGYLRAKSDIAFLNGYANNGLQMAGRYEKTFEFGFGGPLGIADKATFYLSGKYLTNSHRNNGVSVIDPEGNNIGNLPNNGTWVQNLTPRITIPLSDGFKFILGGQVGVTSREISDWTWLYANTRGTSRFTGDLANGITSSEDMSNYTVRQAQQPVFNQQVSNVFARINHTLDPSDPKTFYELTISYNINENNASKRKTFGSPGLLSTVELWEPQDILDLERGYDAAKKANKILDIFENTNGKVRTEDGLPAYSRPDSANPALSVRTPIKDGVGINPLTGFIEGAENNLTTRNAYGLIGQFSDQGNERTMEFRLQRKLKIDGNFNTLVAGDDFTHNIKAGFDFASNELHNHQNSLPWLSNGFLDVYTDRYGGNIYSDNVNGEGYKLTSQSYKPTQGALFISDQIEYGGDSGLVFTPGLRLDYFNPNSSYRTVTDRFVTIDSLGSSSAFSSSKAKINLSPRINISYPITARQIFRLNYTVNFQMPPFSELYDGFAVSSSRGNMLIGDPDLYPQRANQYEVSYLHQLSDFFALDVTVYYKDIFNQVGTIYVPATPTPYFQKATAEYGSSQGLEVQLRKNLSNNYGFSLNYTFATARGTSSSSADNYNAGSDGITGNAVLPLTDYYLNWDRRHRFNYVLDFVWGQNEGAIFGVPVLENASINLSGLFQTGIPYTKTDKGGQAIGEFNGERQPSVFTSDLRFVKSFPLSSLLGEDSKVKMEVFVDVLNLFNFNGPIQVYSRTGSPDNDGASLLKRIGDFPLATYYKDGDVDNSATYDVNQYDFLGRRLYNVSNDTNLDGVVNVQETYEGYLRFVDDAIARRVNYQAPRQVAAGFMLRF